MPWLIFFAFTVGLGQVIFVFNLFRILLSDVVTEGPSRHALRLLPSEAFAGTQVLKIKDIKIEKQGK